MARTFGFIACTTLVVASVWVANSSAPVKTIEAGSEPVGQGLYQAGGAAGKTPTSAGDYFDLGVRLYQNGETAEAIRAFENAQSAPGRLTMPQRTTLKQYLARARRELGDSTADSPSSRNTGESGAYVIAKQMLDDARMHAARGDLATARRLAQRAGNFPVKWHANELSPARFLKELQAGKNPADIGSEFAGTTAAAETAGDNPFAPSSRDIRQVNGLDDKPQITPRRTVAGELPMHDPTTHDNVIHPSGSGDSLSAKEQAQQLLRQARSDLVARRYEEARAKVLAAKQLDVSWGLFEDNPDTVLNAIERSSGVVKLERNTPESRPAGAALPLPSDNSTGDESKPGPLPIAETDTLPLPIENSLPESPDAEESPFAPRKNVDVAPAAPRDEDAGNKQLALELLKQANDDAHAGQFDSARAKLADAQKLDVAYGIFDDRPELVLQVINRLESNATLARSSAKPFPATEERPVNPGVARNNAEKAKVLALLAEARQALQSGRLEEARQKTEEASTFDVAFGIFDDRPELVATLIKAAERDADTMLANNAKPAPFSPEQGPVAPVRPSADDKRLAHELLQAARQDISDSRYEDARAKALEAQKLNVAYDMFDDRPANVLADLNRLSAREVIAQRPGQFGPGPMPPFAEEENDPARSGDLPPNLSDRRIAAVLLKQARADIAAGRLDDAKRKALQAQELKATYQLLEDRPEKVLEEIDRLLAMSPPAESAPVAVNENPFIAPDPVETHYDTHNELAVVHPSGVSALELYNRGLLELRQGNKEAAYTSFLEAYRSGQQLDPRKMQQLQDFLRTLRPSRGGEITLVGGEFPGDPTIGSEPGRIDMADRQMAVKFDRLRTEMLNAIFRAERLKEKNPDDALNVLEQTMAEVESSDLPKEMVGQLLRQLQNSKRSIQGYMKQREPIIALNKRNEEVEAEIRRLRETEVRVEQDLAELVEEYNDLFRQRRYAEAEVLAKKAEDLQPENPVVVTMKWKARFARRDQRINETRDAAEDTRVNVNHDLDDDLVFGVGDKSPLEFGDPHEWQELTERRKKYGSPDNRRRTPEEKRIEESLNRQISLHFNEAPLSEVMQHVQTMTDVNIWLDGLGLQDEGVNTDHPVTIHVNGIMLKSALNLLLEPLHLAYTIEDEVLKVTSRMREQGQQIVVTYPVADLVVPIPNFTGHSGATGMSANGAAVSGFGTPAGNMSIPAMGGLQQPAAAQFQVNDAINGPGFASDPWSGPGMNPRTSGGTAADFDTLAGLITQTIEPESWNEFGGPGSVQQYETTLSLVIRQTQKVHDEIRDLLEQLRRLQDLQVTIEVRFITVADRFFERIGVDFDFNVQDNVGSDPTAFPFGTVTQGAAQAGQQGQQGQAQQGVGGIGGRAMSDSVLPFPMGLQGSNPAMGIGGVGGQGQGQQGQAQQGQQGQQAQAGATGGFDPPNARALTAQDNWPSGGTIVGLSDAMGTFTPDLDVAFRQGSFDIGVPDFGGFNPSAGIQVGLAILSDIEAFFFIQAAQGDERSNLLFAPKVTLFNGQSATVQSTVQRPFVTSLIPTVGFFSVGFTPQITVLSEGVTLTVQAVISADRRFVRLTVVPSFTNITDVFTFSFVSGGGGGGAQQGVQGLGGGAGGVTGQGTGVGGFGGAAGAQQGFGGIGGIGGIGGQGGQGGQVGQQGQQGNQQGQQGQQAAGNITIQQPVFEIVNVTTTVSVPDGGTVLLGGIKRLREGRNMAGVPILNKIPYISRLFKNTGVGRETESLMLMVTPRIIIQEEEEELLGIPAN